jgi:hypothetical protein
MQNDWQKYVTLSPDFTPEQRNQVIKALDFIVHAKDGEGLQLLQAAANNAGQSIVITPSQSGSFQAQGFVGIDFSEAEQLFVQDARTGMASNLSLNGILVHELFHATQPSSNKLAMIEKLDERIKAIPNMPEADKAEVMEALRAYTTEFYNKAISDRLPDGSTKNSLASSSKENPAILEKYGITAEMILTYLASERSVVDKNDIPEVEQAATKFADAFMSKNVGALEPIRGDYANAKLAQDISPVAVFGPSTSLNPSLGYADPKSPNMPTPSVATVAPVGFEGLIREIITTKPDAVLPTTSPMRLLEGFDLKSLAGCGYDASAPCHDPASSSAPAVGAKSAPAIAASGHAH